MLRRKEPLLQQAVFQLFKSHRQVPRPVRGHADTVQLILSVPGKDGHPPGGDDLHPVPRLKAQGGRVAPEHDAPQGPLPVLQGEVVVAGGVALVVGQLPPHQQAGEQPVPVHQTL